MALQHITVNILETNDAAKVVVWYKSTDIRPSTLPLASWLFKNNLMRFRARAAFWGKEGDVCNGSKV